MDRDKSEQSEFDFEYSPEDYSDEEYDVTEWMERSKYDFTEYGFDDEDIQELVGSQVLTIDELEQWKRDDL